MGHAARAREAAERAGRHRVYWYDCRVCARPFPSAIPPEAPCARYDVCQTCLVADVAKLMRTHPETVRLLPSVRVLRDEPLVVPIESRVAAGLGRPES